MAGPKHANATHEDPDKVTDTKAGTKARGQSQNTMQEGICIRADWECHSHRLKYQTPYPQITYPQIAPNHFFCRDVIRTNQKISLSPWMEIASPQIASPPWGGDGRRGATGMMLSRRGNLITLGINRYGRVIQRDTRVPNVLSQYVDPSPAVIPCDTRKENRESRIPHHSTTSSRTHLRSDHLSAALRCNAVAEALNHLHLGRSFFGNGALARCAAGLLASACGCGCSS